MKCHTYLDQIKKKQLYITLAKTFLETYMYVLKDKTSKIVTLQKLLSCSKHSKIQHYNYLYKYKLTILCVFIFYCVNLKKILIQHVCRKSNKKTNYH